MKRTLLLAYLAVIHATLVFMALKSDFLDRVQGATGLAQPGWRHVLLAQQLFQERMDPSVPVNADIFLGDSITHGLATAAVTANSVNFGIGQQTAGQLAASVNGYHSMNNAGRFFLSFGTNDITAKKSDELSKHFQKIIDAIPAGTPLIWSAVMPRIGLTRDIQEANATIFKMCAARRGCIYVDTYKILTNASGELLPNIYSDGIHLSSKGYEIWIKALRDAKNQSVNVAQE